MTSLILLLLVSIHIFESDGPCDYEEHSLSSFMDSGDELSPDVHAEAIEKIPVIGEHFGHSSVILNTFSIPFHLTDFYYYTFIFLTGKIKDFIPENFRPPV